MKNRGVHHVAINVEDVESSREFYVERLGMELLPRPDFGIPGLWLGCGGQQLHLMQVEQLQPNPGPHFALRVDDIDRAREELIAAGVQVSDVIEVGGVCRQCFLYDPSGNTIELNQPA